jgi:Ca2+-binding RTX toxin-like protein
MTIVVRMNTSSSYYNGTNNFTLQMLNAVNTGPGNSLVSQSYNNGFNPATNYPFLFGRRDYLFGGGFDYFAAVSLNDGSGYQTISVAHLSNQFVSLLYGDITFSGNYTGNRTLIDSGTVNRINVGYSSYTTLSTDPVDVREARPATGSEGYSWNGLNISVLTLYNAAASLRAGNSTAWNAIFDNESYDFKGGNLGDQFYGGNLADKLDGGDGNDTLYGGGGADVLLGGAGNDSVFGQGGDDYIEDFGANDGVDTIDGGTGRNTLSFSYNSSQSNYGLTSVYVDLRVGNFAGNAAWTNIQNYVGTSGGDTIWLSDTDGVDNEIYGGYGNDTLGGGVGADVIAGGGDNDSLYGWLGDDILYGDNGNDRLFGEQNNDVLNGGTGQDSLYGGDGNDDLVGGAGDDVIDGGAGVDRVLMSGNLRDYTYNKSNGLFVLRDDRVPQGGGETPEGTDLFSNVERFTFAGGANSPNTTVSSTYYTPVSMNGDLNSDIVWTNRAFGLAASFQLNGTALVGSNTIGGVNGATWQVQATGDLNADGNSDLIWQSGGGLVATFQMNGTPGNGAAGIASAAILGQPGGSYRVVDTGDFNGDGNSDILFENDAGQAMAWIMSNGTIQFAAQLGGANGVDWSIAAVGDLNGDGRSDIVWEHTDGRTSGWLMNGGFIGSFAELAGPNGTNFSVKGIGDLNGDGFGDIVYQYANGQAGVWFMNGLTITAARGIGSPNGSQFEIREIGDINGDAFSDIVWQNTTNGQAVGFMMQGNSIMASGNIGPANGADWFIV